MAHRQVSAAVRLAAVAEIGGAWLVWQGVREHKGWIWIGAGVIALGLYGFVATLQPDANFGRILAAYGGVFVAGSLAWGMVARQVPPRPLRHHRRAHLPGRRRRHHVRAANVTGATPLRASATFTRSIRRTPGWLVTRPGAWRARCGACSASHRAPRPGRSGEAASSATTRCAVATYMPDVSVQTWRSWTSATPGTASRSAHDLVELHPLGHVLAEHGEHLATEDDRADCDEDADRQSHDGVPPALAGGRDEDPGER